MKTFQIQRNFNTEFFMATRIKKNKRAENTMIRIDLKNDWSYQIKEFLIKFKYAKKSDKINLEFIL